MLFNLGDRLRIFSGEFTGESYKIGFFYCYRKGLCKVSKIPKIQNKLG